MRSLNKSDLKRIARRALESTFGFTVSRLSDIILLEADGDGAYILFEVNGHEYRYRNGAITRLEEEYTW